MPHHPASTARRRLLVHTASLSGAACGGWLAAPAARAQTAAAAGPPGPSKIGIVSLLGNLVRIYARENTEVLFRDVGMDNIVLDLSERLLRDAFPQAALQRLAATGDTPIDAQVRIGTAAGRRGTLPDWIRQAATDGGWSHLLLLGSDIGPMEFRTGLADVVGNGSVSGPGFWVGADYRWRNEKTGATWSGYLAPFVQLRLSWIELTGPSPKALHSVRLSEGYATGPSESEAPNPWLFLNLQQKAAALRRLLTSNVERGVPRVLKGE